MKKIANSITNLYLVDTLNPSGYSQVLEEPTVSGTTTNLAMTYTYGLALTSQRQGVSSPVYFVTDGDGSTRLILDGFDDKTFMYDAYGNLIDPGDPPATTRLYCGEEWDPDLGMYYLRARYLNPNTGRFWTMDTYQGRQEDPISFHKYLYVGSDPVNKGDPIGRDAELDSIGVTFSHDILKARLPFSVFLLKPFMCDDCNDETATEGLAQLKKRFSLAKLYVDNKGLEIDARGSGPGKVSCYKSNSQILHFMQYLPRCWMCYMDRRRMPKPAHGPWWDENFIHCFSLNKIGTKREVIFDWFHSREYNDNGIYENIGGYYQFYPDTSAPLYPSSPVGQRCDQPVKKWRPDFERLDWLFSSDGNM